MSKEIEQAKPQEIQVVNLESVKEAMKAFQRFKGEVLGKGDFWVDSKNNSKHVRKPGWEKYAMALGISTDFFDERSELIKFKGDEVLVFHFSGRATAPNGRSAARAGSASSDEDRVWSKTIHGIRTMAQTRAVLRAISALVGGGELTAEELDTKGVDAEYRVKSNEGHLDKGAKISPEQNGNEYDPVSLWVSVLKENGVKDDVIEQLEFTVEGYNMIIRPRKYLGDLWGPVNDAVKAGRGFWVKDEADKTKNHWEGPC